jgi:hypothetical protein
MPTIVRLPPDLAPAQIEEIKTKMAVFTAQYSGAVWEDDPHPDTASPNRLRGELSRFRERVEQMATGYRLIFETPDTPLAPEKIAAFEDALRRLEDPSAPLTEARMLATYTEILDTMLVDIQAHYRCDNKAARNILSRAEHLAVLDQTRPTVITVVPMGTQLHALIDTPLPALSAEMRRTFIAVARSTPDTLSTQPPWFQAMPSSERALFQKKLKQIQVADPELTTLTSIPSTLRSIPGVANFRVHEHVILEPGKPNIHIPAQVASSVIAARDHTDPAISDGFAAQNAAHIIDTVRTRDPTPTGPIFFQTLLSKGLNPVDDALYASKQRGVEAYRAQAQTATPSPPVLESNHPLNTFRVSQAFRTGYLDKFLPLEIRLGLLVRQPPVPEIVHQAIAAYEKADRQTDTTALSDKQLYLAALEDIIVSHVDGIAHGSCVSGKDRKGTELIYKDALMVHFQQYGRFPLYSQDKNLQPPLFPGLTAARQKRAAQAAIYQTERQAFAATFVTLFLSQHHQHLAGLNTAGCAGIKNIDHYLSADLAAAIRSRDPLALPLSNFRAQFNSHAKPPKPYGLPNAAPVAATPAPLPAQDATHRADHPHHPSTTQRALPASLATKGPAERLKDAVPSDDAPARPHPTHHTPPAGSA